MVNYEKLLAGAFAGAGAITLILVGHVSEGAIILSAMMGFFIGDQNGNKTATQALAKALEESTETHDVAVHGIEKPQ